MIYEQPLKTRRSAWLAETDHFFKKRAQKPRRPCSVRVSPLGVHSGLTRSSRGPISRWALPKSAPRSVSRIPKIAGGCPSIALQVAEN